MQADLNYYQALLDDIRRQLEWQDDAGDSFERLATLGHEYGEVCSQVNLRLRNCSSLLRRGLRAEAIQQSEQAPNLVELTTLLDFPDLPRLVDALASLGLKRPPAIFLDEAAELNGAYAAHEPLERLLETQRRLALARAPLRMRIAHMRQIASIDTNNSFWLDDLALFEEERFRQIKREAKSAAKAENVTVLQSLAEELLSESWVRPVPAGLSDEVVADLSALRRAQAREELNRLDDLLNEAFVRLDFPAAQQLQQRFVACAQVAVLAPNDPLIERVQPALDWIASQERQRNADAIHATALAQLESALNDGEPLDSLERKYDAVVRNGRSAPPHLERRYRERAASLGLAATRRSRLIAAGIGAAMIALAAVVGVVVAGWRRNATIAVHLEYLEVRIADGRLAEADSYLRDLAATDPDTAASPALRDAASRIESAARAAAERQESFERLLARAKAGGAESPDTTALAEAEKLAESPTEKLAVAEFQAAVAEVNRRRRTERDAAFRQRLEALTKEVQAASDRRDLAPDAMRTEVARLRAALTELQAGQANASEALRAQADQVALRLQALSTQVEQSVEQERHLASLTDLIGDYEKFAKGLEQHAAGHPDTARAADFGRVVQEEALWTRVARWNELVREAHRLDLTTISPSAALEVANRWRPTLDELGTFPRSSELSSRLHYLESIAARTFDAGEGTPIQRLMQVFRDPTIDNVWLVQTTTGERYYAKQEPKPDAGEHLFVQMLLGLDGGRTRRKRLLLEEVEYRGESGQATVAKKLAEVLSQSPMPPWETTFTAAVEAIIRQERIDPVIQVILLKKVLETGGSGSTIWKDAFAPALDRFSTGEIDLNCNWVNPENEKARPHREDAASEVARAFSESAWADCKQRIETGLAEIRRPAANEYLWVGWLRRSAADWAVANRLALPGEGRLFITFSSADGSLEMAPIGVAEKGKTRVEATDSAALVEGRPVYWIAAEQE